MTESLNAAAYRQLLSMARRHARGRIEAEDLLQEAMVAALASGTALRVDDRAWLGGVMRNIALMNARSAIRRRRREDSHARPAEACSSAIEEDFPDLSGLSHGLRIVALLALAGQTRGEIRHLLRISDDALRQRISGLKRHWAKSQSGSPPGLPALHGRLAFGSIRRGLLPLVRAGKADFASHDPDGHPLAFTIVRR